MANKGQHKQQLTLATSTKGMGLLVTA